MSEAQQTSANTTADAQREYWCCRLRRGIEEIAGAFAPPEAASSHFREARIEVLRGIREMIDYRIQRLSRENTRGSRIVVE